MPLPTSLVLNWHLTEACNYRCQYCYATWDAPTYKYELIRNPERTAALLHELYSFFRPDNKANPLAKLQEWSSVRLNLAGGEPLLHAEMLMPIINQARELGFDVSLISNGSLLNGGLLNQLAKKLTWLGISIDSINTPTNVRIGRVDCRGHVLTLDELAASLIAARQSNPALRIKLNSVVNRHNHSEDLSPAIRQFMPDKWKVLRMLPVVNQSLTVTDEQFAAFVARHQSFASFLCAEDHHDMRESYIMIDPTGRFFQNSLKIPGSGYAYSRPILEVGTGAAFADVDFAHQRFCERYLPPHTGEERA